MANQPASASSPLGPIAVHDHSQGIRLARLKWKEKKSRTKTDLFEIGSFIGVPNDENPHGGVQRKTGRKLSDVRAAD